MRMNVEQSIIKDWNPYKSVSPAVVGFLERSKESHKIDRTYLAENPRKSGSKDGKHGYDDILLDEIIVPTPRLARDVIAIHFLREMGRKNTLNAFANVVISHAFHGTRKKDFNDVTTMLHSVRAYLYEDPSYPALNRKKPHSYDTCNHGKNDAETTQEMFYGFDYSRIPPCFNENDTIMELSIRGTNIELVDDLENTKLENLSMINNETMRGIVPGSLPPTLKKLTMADMGEMEKQPDLSETSIEAIAMRGMPIARIDGSLLPRSLITLEIAAKDHAKRGSTESLDLHDLDQLQEVTLRRQPITDLHASNFPPSLNYLDLASTPSYETYNIVTCNTLDMEFKQRGQTVRLLNCKG